MKEQIIRVKDRVRDLLATYPKLRDDDKRLYLSYIYLHSNITSLRNCDASEFLRFIQDSDIPPPEIVRRARQLIQNKEGLYRGTRQLEKAVAEHEVRTSIGSM